MKAKCLGATKVIMWSVVQFCLAHFIPRIRYKGQAKRSKQSLSSDTIIPETSTALVVM